MNKFLMASVIGAVLIASIAMSPLLISKLATAKEGTCDLSVGGKCVIVAKKGDIEIDRLTIIANSNPAFNDTALKNTDLALQGQIDNLNNAIKNVTSSGGITSLEVIEGGLGGNDSGGSGGGSGGAGGNETSGGAGNETSGNFTG